MAGQNLTLTLSAKDKKRFDELIAKVIDGVQNLDGFFDAVEMHMIDSLTQNFEQGGRPIKWQPLSPVTIELKGSTGILQDQGLLKASINASNTFRTETSLEIWAGERHGLFHQLADTDPMDQFQMVNKRGMPFRPFILFQDEDITEIERILERYMDDVMK